MKESTKDLLCLCLSGAGITFVNLWPSFFTYYTSLSYYKNPNTRVNLIYATYFFFLVGKLLGSVLYPYMFFVFGTTLMYTFMVISEIFMSIYSYMYVSFIAISFVNLQKGLLFQGIITASNIILSEKFKNGILKNKHINTARIISSVIGTFVCQYIVNPQNKNQNVHDKSGDYFFPKDIAQNFQFFLLFYTLFNALLVSAPLIFVKSPLNYNCKLKNYINYLFGKESFNFQIDNKNLTEQKNTSEQISIADSIHEKSLIEIPSIQSEQTKSVGLYNIQNIDIKFIHFLGIFVAINFGICYYCIQMYKYVSLILGFSDVLISMTLTLGLIPYIASSYLAAYLWSNYGFDCILIAIFIFNIINLIGIVLSKSYFIFQIFISRQNGGLILIFQDIFCFSIFDTLEAMKYMKYFMFYNTLGNLSQVLLNFLFFDGQNYKFIFTVFTGLCLLSAFVHYKFMYKKINHNQQQNSKQNNDFFSLDLFLNNFEKLNFFWQFEQKKFENGLYIIIYIKNKLANCMYRVFKVNIQWFQTFNYLF